MSNQLRQLSAALVAALHDPEGRYTTTEAWDQTPALEPTGQAVVSLEGCENLMAGTGDYRLDFAIECRTGLDADRDKGRFRVLQTALWRGLSGLSAAGLSAASGARVVGCFLRGFEEASDASGHTGVFHLELYVTAFSIEA